MKEGFALKNKKGVLVLTWIISGTALIIAIVVLFGYMGIKVFAETGSGGGSGTNHVLSFQGRLTKPDGSYVDNGCYGMTFGIYKQSSGGTALWAESHANSNCVQVNDSVFKVLLGSSNAITVDFNSEPYWLGIQLQGESEMIPRSRIGSSAHSLNSELLDGLSASDFTLQRVTAYGGSSSNPISLTGELDLGNGTNGIFVNGSSLSLYSSSTVEISNNVDVSGTFISGAGNAFQINSSGIVTSGVWHGTAIDISSYTNLDAGSHLTLSGDTLNVDDDFLLNTGDTGAGAYIFSSTVNLQGIVTFGSGATSYQFPTARGSNNQILITDAAGGVTWQNQGAGFADPMTTRGDVIFRDATNTTARLGAGLVGQVLQSDGTDIAWQTLALTDLVNVTSATPTAGHILLGQGAAWENKDVSGDIDIAITGVATIQANSVLLGTDTTGNYVESITNGSGISGGDGGSEGAALTISLGVLTANWNQTGAFDIVLNNASSELQILESVGGAFYGTLDVGNLAADATYTLDGTTGTILTDANYTGTLNPIYMQVANNLSDVANAATSRTNLGLGIGNSPEFTGLTLSGLTASRLIAADGAKALSSVASLTSWIAGTANQITVSDDLDGSVTLSTPQDIGIASSVTFGGLTVDGTANLNEAVNLGNGVADVLAASGIWAGQYPFYFEGLTADDYETRFEITDPTLTDKTITFQNASGTVAFTSDIPGGAGLWSQTGTVIHQTTLTNGFAIGATSLVAPFSVDESTNAVRIGDGAGTDATLTMYASDTTSGILEFDVTDNRFEFNDDVYTSGSFVSGSTITINGAAATNVITGTARMDITAGAASTWSTSVGLLTLQGAAGVTVDANGGNLTLDAATGYDVAVTLGGAAGDDFYVDSDDVFLVESDDNQVGIGTSSPTARLYVSGITGDTEALYVTKTTNAIGDNYAGNFYISGASGAVYTAALRATNSSSANIEQTGIYVGNTATGFNNYGLDIQVTGGITTNQGVYVLIYGSSGVSYGFHIDNIATTASTDHYGGYFSVSGTANAATKYGARGYVTGAGTGTTYNYGIFGSADDATNSYGGYFAATDATGPTTNYGIYATASGAATNWAGYFSGNVHATGTISSGATITINGVSNIITGSAALSMTSTSADLTLRTTTSGNVLLDSTGGYVQSQDNFNAVAGLDVSGEALTFTGTAGSWTFALADSALTQIGTGQVTFSGNADANAGFDVGGGALTFTGTLGSWTFVQATSALTQTGTGQVTLTGNLDAANGLDVTGAALTIANQAITQTTGGQVTFAGNVDATNGLDVTTASLTVGGANFSVTTAGAVTIASTLDANGQIELGDGGETAVITTSDWGISTTGGMTGIDSIASSGNISFLPSGDNDDYLYVNTTSNLSYIYWEGQETNDPGIGVNASGQLVYRDNDETDWTTFDSLIDSLWTDGGTYIYPTTAGTGIQISDSGYLGIGTSPPSYPLHILQTASGVGPVDTYTSYFELNVSAGIGTSRGLYVDLNKTGASAVDVYGGVFDVVDSGAAATNVIGVYVPVTGQTGGTNVYGVYANMASAGADDYTNFYGVYGNLAGAADGTINYGVVGNVSTTQTHTSSTDLVAGVAGFLDISTAGTITDGTQYYGMRGQVTFSSGTCSSCIINGAYFNIHNDGTITGSTDPLDYVAALRAEFDSSGTWTNNYLYGLLAKAEVTNSSSGRNWGVRAAAANGTMNYGVEGKVAGSVGSNNFGVLGEADITTAGSSNYGGYFYAHGTTTGTNYGIYAEASGGATNWAGYFEGNVYLSSGSKLSINSGTPTYELQVAGDGYISSGFGVGTAETTNGYLRATRAGLGVAANAAYGLNILESSASGRGLNISETGTSGTIYGEYISSNGATTATTAYGTFATATGATTNYGILGTVDGAGTSGYGVYGTVAATATQTNQYGVYGKLGHNITTNTQFAGYFESALTGAGGGATVTLNVKTDHQITTDSKTGYGIQSWMFTNTNTGTDGRELVAIRSAVDDTSTDDNVLYGVLAQATGNIGDASVGVYAASASASNTSSTSYGAYAIANNASTKNYGIYAAVGNGTNAGTDYAGWFDPGTNVEYGVYVDSGATTASINSLGTYSDTVGVTNRDLYIDNTGKIGYVSSALKYKQRVANMEDVSWLYKLHPVNYEYKKYPGTKQYGLIAEEVDNVNKSFVSYDKQGKPETVSYSMLVTPLLQSVQDHQRQITDFNTQLETLKKQVADLSVAGKDGKLMAGVVEGNLGITGNLDVGGSIKASSILSKNNTWSIDSNGNLKIKTITADEINAGKINTEDIKITEGVNKQMGVVKIPIGTAVESFVSNTSVTTDSTIWLTFESDYAPAVKYWISKKEEGKGFTVKFDQAPAKEVTFKYLIVN